MQSIAQAFSWEVFTRGKWTLLAMLLLANLMPLLWFTPIGTAAKFYENDSTFVTLHSLTIVINGFVFGIGVFIAIGDPSRLYLMPLRNRSIALMHMLPAMALVAVEIAVMCWTINYFLDLQWPILNYVLFAAAAWGVFHAVFLLCGKQFWGVFCLIFVLSAMVLWLKARHGPVWSAPSHKWQTLTASEFITLGLWLLGALWLSERGVARERRGDALSFEWMKQRVVRCLDFVEEKLFVNHRNFVSIIDAQLWYEWRKGGWAMPFVATIISFVAIFLIAFSSDSSDRLVDVFSVSIVFLSVGAYGAGFALGVSQTKWPKRVAAVSLEDALFENQPAIIGAFLGTRPLYNHDIARCISRTMCRSMILAWLIWNGVVLLMLTTMWTLGVAPKSDTRHDALILMYALTFFVPWIALVIGVSTMLTGRQSVVMGTLLLIIGGVFCVTILIESVVPEDQREIVKNASITVFSLLVSLGIAGAFWRVWRRELVPKPNLIGAIGVAACLVALFIALHPANIPFWMPYFPVMLGAIAISVSPVACLTLAVAANRHR